MSLMNYLQILIPKSLIQRWSALGDAVESLSKTIPSGTDTKEIGCNVALNIIGATIKGIAKILEVISPNDSELNGLDRSHAVKAKRELLIGRIYFEALFDAVENLKLQVDFSARIPAKIFNSLVNEPITIGENVTARDLRQDNIIFENYRIRLSDFLNYVLSGNQNLEKLIDDIHKEARLRCAEAISNDPCLAIPFIMNSAAKLEDQAEEFAEFLTYDGKRGSRLSTDRFPASDLFDLEAKRLGPTASNQAKLELIRSIMSLPSGEESSLIENLPGKIQTAFNEAKGELAEGSHEKARLLFGNLIELISDSKDRALSEIKARATASIGVIEYANHNFEVAFEYFDRAYYQNPDNTSCAAFYAISLSARGREEEALSILNQILVKDSQNENAIVVAAQIRSKIHGLESALSFLDEYPLCTPLWYDCKAFLYSSVGDYSSCEAVSEQGLKLFPGNLELSISLATAIAMPISESRLLRLDYRPEKQTAALDRSFRVHCEIIPSLRLRGRKRELVAVLLNAATLAHTLNKYAEARQYLAEVGLLDSRNARAKSLMCMTYLETRDKDIALHLAKELFSDTGSVEHFNLLLSCLIEAREYSEAINASELYEKQIGHNEDLILIKCRKLEVLQLSHKRLEADKLAKNLEENYAFNETVLGTLAEFYSARNLEEKAVGLFQKAIQIADGFNKLPHLLGLAGLFYGKQDWARAIQIYREIGSLKHTQETLCNLAHCYYQVGKLEKAHELLTKIEREKSSPRLLEVRAVVENELSDFEATILTLSRLQAISPRQKWEIYLAQVHFKNGDREMAYGIFRDIADADPENFEVKLQAGQACYAMGFFTEGFKFALDAHKENPSDPTAKMLVASIGLFPHNIELSPEENEFIRNCTETMEFVRKVELAKNEGGDFDFEPIFKELRDRREHVEGRLAMYHRDKNPISILSRVLFGMDPWQAWMNMTRSPNGAIYMSDGDQASQEAQENRAIECLAGEIAVDIYVIFCLASLGLLKVFSDNFKKIFISSESLASVQRSLDNLVQGESSCGTLVFDNGKYVYIENDLNSQHADSTFLKEVVKYLGLDPKIAQKGLSPRVLLSWREKLGSNEAVDDAVMPMCVSISLGVPFYSDQLVLRKLYSRDSNLKSFCTQDFLRALRFKGEISEDVYNDSIIWLLAHHYSFVSINVSTFERAFKNDGLKLGANTKLLLRQCTEKGSVSDKTTAILAEAVVRILGGVCSKDSNFHEITIEFAKAAGVYAQDSRVFTFIQVISRKLLWAPSFLLNILDGLAFGGLGTVREHFILSATKMALFKIFFVKKRRVPPSWTGLADIWSCQIFVDKFILMYNPMRDVKLKEVMPSRTRDKSRRKRRRRRK